MSFPICLTIFIIIIMPMFLTFIRNQKHEQNRLPPGPKRLPFIGNLHQLGQSPHRTLECLSRRHGPLMFLQLGSVPTLVVSSASMAKEVCKTHDLVFSSRPSLCAVNKLGYKSSTISFAPCGEYWRQIRKIALVELLSVRKVQSFEAIREQEVANMIETVSNSLSCQINMTDLMLLLANKIVLRVVFSSKGNNYVDMNVKSEFDGILRETQDLLGMVNIADYLPWMGRWLNKLNGVEARLDKNFQQLDSFYDNAIQEHRECLRRKPGEHEDLVDVLLRLQTDPNQDSALTDDQIKAVLTDMFIAGTDTSSATLVWLMSELIRNPSVMKKAQEEVRGLVKGTGAHVQESDLPKLEYLKMITKEALRLHPPVPLLLPRESTEARIIGGYVIPAKTRVLINATAISMDREHWEDPEEFKPERFLNSCIDFRGQHFELIPFGAGRRGCPGINFAVLVIELALANLLLRFDWRVPDGMNIKDIDMEEAVGLTVHKKTPLCLVPCPPSQ